MEKEIKIGFAAQSKSVIETVEIKWKLTEEEANSEKYINEELLL